LNLYEGLIPLKIYSRNEMLSKTCAELGQQKLKILLGEKRLNLQ